METHSKQMDSHFTHMDSQSNYMEGYSNNMQAHPHHMEGFTKHMEGFANHMEGFAKHMEGFAKHMEGFAKHMESHSKHMEAYSNHMETYISIELAGFHKKLFFKAKDVLQKSMPDGYDYKILGNVSCLIETYRTTQSEKGKYIVATNEMDCRKLPDIDVIKGYKGQSKAERGDFDF